MIINPFGNKEPDPVFESLTDDLEYVIVRRDFILR